MSAPVALAVLRAEGIKLSTTRWPLWSALGVLVLSLGLAAVQGWTSYGSRPLPPARAALGVAVFGVPVLMVLASSAMTGEYRSGLIRTTFTATPGRSLVLVAKAVVNAVFSAGCAALAVVAAVMVAGLAAERPAGSALSLTGAGTWRLAGAIALYAALAAVLAVAVGALVRFSAGAVAVLLLWPMVAEPLLGNMPGFGPAVGPFLPFANMFRFLDVTWLYPAYAVPWGPVGSLVYFGVFMALIFGAAAVVLDRRDA